MPITTAASNVISKGPMLNGMVFVFDGRCDANAMLGLAPPLAMANVAVRTVGAHAAF
jgi:hypothetical protein